MPLKHTFIIHTDRITTFPHSLSVDSPPTHSSFPMTLTTSICDG